MRKNNSSNPKERRAFLGLVGGAGLLGVAGYFGMERTGYFDENNDLVKYDVEETPISSFDHFWDFSAEDPLDDKIGEAHLEVASNEVEVGTNGIFEDDAITVDEDGYVRHKNEGLTVDVTGSFSMGAWLNHEETGDYSAAMLLINEEEDEALGIGPNSGSDGDDQPLPKVLSVANTAGSGDTFYEYGDWHFHVLRYDVDENEAELYFDGEFEYSVEPDDGRDWIPDLDAIVLGFRPVGSSDYHYLGRIAYPWVADGLISESTIQTLLEDAGRN